MKALVADDSRVMRAILVQVLSQVGFTEVDQAEDGKIAAEAGLAQDYGLVLLDWNMPHMLGIDVLKALRAGGRRMPIIMVTTEAEKVRIIEALRAGANNYIIKPFQPAAIIPKIRETLEKAAAQTADGAKP